MMRHHRLHAHLASLRVECNSIAGQIGRGIPVIARFAGVQAMAQGLGLAAGLILVRALDKHDYALYTLTITGINAMAMLSNGGIVDAATAIGGRAWQESRHMGQVVASATRFQNRLAAMVFPPIALVVAWLLAHNGAGVSEMLILPAAACVAAHLQISTAILGVVLRLKSQIKQLQNLDLSGSLLRVALSAALFTVLYAEVATLIVVASAAMTYVLSRRWVAPTIDGNAQPDSEMLTRMGSVVRRQWVSDLAFIFQGQITLLLLGIFGRSDTVADFGALGRIAAIFGIVGAVMQSIVLPRYARCQDPSELRKLHAVILLGFVGVSALPVVAALVFPQPLLWILGAKYGNLSHELVLVTLSASAGALAFTAWGLNSVRAWIIPAWFNVPLIFVSQSILMAIIGVSTMDQMLWVGIFWNFFSALISVAATVVFSKGFTRA